MSINLDDLTVGQAKELAAVFAAQLGTNDVVATPNQLAYNGAQVIAVLQRGHVAVGIYKQRGNIAMLKKAAIVRRWGTSEGLGELAEKGPLENTKLDKCPDLTFHIREAIFIMEAKDAWGNYFNKY